MLTDNEEPIKIPQIPQGGDRPSFMSGFSQCLQTAMLRYAGAWLSLTGIPLPLLNTMMEKES